MSEMIERVAWTVAWAIDEKDLSIKDIARAAIEAMRVPTEEMEAVILVSGGLAAEDVWPAMIDAALK